MAQDSGTIETGQDTANGILGNFWPTFNVDGPYFDVTECAQAGDSMAVFALNQYGIPLGAGATAGGSLGSIDIKRMDVMTVVNQSLMEELPGTGNLVEPIVNEAGEVEFIEIGSTGGNISDIYYTVQTHSHTEEVKGVMITGGRPLPLRKRVEWKPIWGEGENDSLVIYDYSDMLDNCHIQNFSRYVVMTFDDPFLGEEAYEDGRADTLFDVNSPWESRIGYAYYIKVPEEYTADRSDYTVNYAKTATIPIRIGALGEDTGGVNNPTNLITKIADLGTIQTLPQYDPSQEGCWRDRGGDVNFELGVKVPIRDEGYNNLTYYSLRGTTIDKFVRVSAVYAIGVLIDYVKSAPATDADAAIANTGATNYEYRRWVYIEDKQTQAFKLTEGKNYGVYYDEEDLQSPYIVFAQEKKTDDPATYGTNVSFYIDPTCKYARLDPQVVGVYKGSVLPIDQNRGILVEEIWVTVDLETPSIVVNDPRGQARLIAEGLVYYIGSIKMEQEPAPIGYCGTENSTGEIVDQTTGIQDNDPTTAIDAEAESRLEELYDSMQGGGMALTLSFLDESNVARLACNLYGKMQYNGPTTVYTCGPCAHPQLGRAGNAGGVINSIQYSYSDKGSYTVSVQEGPYILGGLSPVDGGPTQKATEEHQAKGTIIKDAGNNVHFKVLIDGYGERWAINSVPTILRVGDIVSVTVHNNPVEA